MNQQALLLTLMSGLCTGIGGILGVMLRGYGKKMLGVMLGLSAGIMTTVSLLDILPASFGMLQETIGGLPAMIGVVLSLIGGMLFGTFLDLTMKEQVGEKQLYRLGVFSMISLMAHNLPEGIAVYVSSERDLSLGLGLAIAIGIHNIPEGIAIALPISYNGGSAMKGFGYSLLSGLAEPLGGLLGCLLLSVVGKWLFLEYVMAGVAGLMIYLSFGEILPSAVENGGVGRMAFGVMLGIVIMSIGVFMS